MSIDITRGIGMLKEDVMTEIVQNRGQMGTKALKTNILRRRGRNNIAEKNKSTTNIDQNQYYDSYTASKPSTAEMDKRTKLTKQPSTPDSDRSEVNLPKAQVIVRAGLTDNELLQVYQMNCSIHENDRENARVINQSLTFNRQV